MEVLLGSLDHIRVERKQAIGFLSVVMHVPSSSISDFPAALPLYVQLM